MEKKLNKIIKAIIEKIEINNSDVEKKNENTFLVYNKTLLDIIENMPPRLKQENAEVSLGTIYDAGYHKKTKSLFVCNKGAFLLSRTTELKKYYAVAHYGFSIFTPGHGIETVDVGIVGDITRGDFIVLRPESACSPSFIVGSQRCNCYDQWTLIQELAAFHNPINIPKNISPKELESFTANYYTTNKNNIPIPKTPGPGFIFMHMSSQNGMGSGVDNGKYSDELTATAYMRHRGEYTAEQVHSKSLAGGFTALGITPDPRTLNNCSGYKIPSVILDYFNIDKPIITLTNNNHKVTTLKKLGYDITRVQFVGRSDVACGIETHDRTKEFSHEIPIDFKTTLEEDLSRVNKEINKIFQIKNLNKK